MVLLLTHVVDVERALFAGDLADAAVLHGALAALAVLIEGPVVGTRAVRAGSA